MSQLVADYDGETPTAGSGLVTAPAALWVGREQAAPELRQRPLRVSDATALVDFVPEGVTETDPMNAPSQAALTIPAARARKDNLLFAKLAALTALAVVVIVAMWVLWR